MFSACCLPLAHNRLSTIGKRGAVAIFRETIDREIGYDLWIYRHRALQAECTERRLDQLAVWIDKAADGQPHALSNVVRPRTFSLYRAAWDNRDPDVLAALPPKDRQKYVEFYDELANNAVNSTRERDAWTAFTPYEVSGVLSIEDRRKLHAAVELARQLNRSISNNVETSFEIASVLGVTPVEPDGMISDEVQAATHCPTQVLK